MVRLKKPNSVFWVTASKTASKTKGLLRFYQKNFVRFSDPKKKCLKMEQKSTWTSFRVRVATKSCSKYTTKGWPNPMSDGQKNAQKILIGKNIPI